MIQVKLSLFANRRWAGHEARMEKCRGSFKIFTSKHIRRRPLGRPRRRWVDNITMDLKKYVSIRGIGLIRLTIRIIGEHLWMRHWICGFHKPWSSLVLHFTMQKLHLLGFSAQTFRCRVHHYQCLAVLVELAVMAFASWFIAIGIAGMLIWLACAIVSKSVRVVLCNWSLLWRLFIMFISHNFRQC